MPSSQSILLSQLQELTPITLKWPNVHIRIRSQDELKRTFSQRARGIRWYDRNWECGDTEFLTIIVLMVQGCWMELEPFLSHVTCVKHCLFWERCDQFKHGRNIIGTSSYTLVIILVIFNLLPVMKLKPVWQVWYILRNSIFLWLWFFMVYVLE